MPDIDAVYRNVFVSTALVLALSAAAHAQTVSLVNAELTLTDQVTLRIPRLRGQIVAMSPVRPLPFHPDALMIRIDAAEVRFTTASLTALMNGYVLQGAKIHDVVIDTDASKREVIIHGPVDLRGPMSVSGEVIHLRRNKQWLPFVDGLINWNDGPAHGIEARNGTIILDPIKMIAPLLRIEGHLTAIAVEDKEIVETFGPPEPSPPPQQPGSMRVEGGDLAIADQRAESGWVVVGLRR